MLTYPFVKVELTGWEKIRVIRVICLIRDPDEEVLE